MIFLIMNKMDIEDFSYEEIKDELLKIVDEMFNRGFTEKEIFKHIQKGERKQI